MAKAHTRSSVQSVLEQALQNRIGSGIAAAWGTIGDRRDDQQIYLGVEGHAGVAGRTTSAIHAETYFDLASLTKILATTSIVMVACDRGELSLSEKPSSEFSVLQLLTHTSGLPAWKPIYQKLIQRFGAHLSYVSPIDRHAEFMGEALAIAQEQAAGVQVVYSDLGFLHLQDFLEKRFGRGLDSLAQDWVWGPCRVNLHYRPIRMDALGERHRIQQSGESVAMTEWCPWRGLLQGQVQDDNAWSMGGIAGHAGVFGRLADVVSWVHHLFDETFVSCRTLTSFLQESTVGLNSRRALGFDFVPLDGSGSTAFALSPQTVGHLGYTGTSVWMDLFDRKFAILLTNRVHPDRSDTRIQDLRRAFHQAIRA